MNEKNLKFLKIYFIYFQYMLFMIYFLTFTEMIAKEKLPDLNEKKTKIIRNLKTFSGPMGMGLTKSYEKDSHKFCIYNTINGQKTISSKNLNFECPKKYKNY